MEREKIERSGEQAFVSCLHKKAVVAKFCITVPWALVSGLLFFVVLFLTSIFLKFITCK